MPNGEKTPNNSGDNLLPCPFCQMPVELRAYDGEYAIGCLHHNVCGNADTGWRSTSEEAIAAWNTRAPSPAEVQPIDHRADALADAALAMNQEAASLRTTIAELRAKLEEAERRGVRLAEEYLAKQAETRASCAKHVEDAESERDQARAALAKAEEWRALHIGEVASLSGDVDREKALREEAEQMAAGSERRCAAAEIRAEAAESKLVATLEDLELAKNAAIENGTDRDRAEAKLAKAVGALENTNDVREAVVQAFLCHLSGKPIRDLDERLERMKRVVVETRATLADIREMKPVPCLGCHNDKPGECDYCDGEVEP